MKLLRPLLLLAVCAAFLTACRKDQDFTDESGITLDFSRDTVLFDTIFTQSPGSPGPPYSVNKRFTVHNPSSNAVRVDIALEGGSPSPYRINVDGASGIMFDDVEIYGGDSLYVFVEVTLDQNNSSNPFIIEDHILFNTNGNEQEVLLLAWGQDAHFIFPDQSIQGLPRFSYIAGGFDENGNQICETVIWPDDLPYVIYGYGVVDSCCTLIIEPGVDIYMHGGAGLWVYRYGQVKANGDISQEITFQGDRLEPAFDELPGQWDRIWLNEGPAENSNEFTNVVIKNALVGIQCENVPWIPGEPGDPPSATKVKLTSVKIRNCSAAGILSRNYSIEAANLLVGDCGQYGVALTGSGQYAFDHFTIANYFDYDIRQTPAFYMNNVYAVANTLQIRPITNSSFRNGIIHGSNENEFLIEFNELSIPTSSDLTFDHTMFRTTEPTNTEYFPDQSTIHRNQSPAFRDVTARDLHLTVNSFARDKADPNSEAFFDLDGIPRGQDGTPDLGCYEFVE